MNSIIRLRLDDFEIQKGTKGQLLCVGIKGISMVMFYSPLCKNICMPLLPQFNQLPNIISNVKFCTLNINEHVGIIPLSEHTISPIKFVPFIILYVDGRPFLQYDDQPVLSKMVDFVKYSLKLIESKRSFIDKGAKVDQAEIPKYTIGKPYLEFKCDENGLCLLTQNEAYKPRIGTS
jgi:hypothetical protein